MGNEVENGDTEEKDELRRTEERYHALFDASSVAMFVHRDGVIIEANQAMAEVVGYTVDELKGTDLMRYIAPEDRDLVKRNVKHAVEDPCSIEVVRKDGTRRTIEGTAKAIQLGDGPARQVTVRDVTDIQAREEALHEIEERYRGLFTNSLAATLITNMEGEVLEANERMASVLGTTVEDLRSRNILDFYWDPRDRDSVLDALKGDDHVLNKEIPGKTLQGERIWVDFSIRRIRFKDKDALLSTLIDITDKKLAAEALRESEERFRMIHQAAPIGLVLADAERNLLEVNPTFERITGYGRDELLDMNHADLCHPEDVDHVARSYQDLVEGTGDTKEIKERLITKDGGTVTLNTTMTAIRDRDGEFLYGLVLLEDITEVLGQQEELRKSEERFRNIYQMVPIGIILAEVGGNIVEANPFIEDILGSSKDELYDKKPLDITHPDDVIPTKELMEDIVDGTVSTRRLENRYIGRDGSIIWTNTVVTALRDRDGEPIYLLALIEDISEKKASEEALQFRLDFEDLIQELSTRFVGVRTEDVDGEIERALKDVSSFAGADTGYVFRTSSEASKCTMTHLWSAKGSPRTRERHPAVDFGSMPDWFGRIMANESVAVKVEGESSSDAARGTAEGMPPYRKNIIAVPLTYQGVVEGFLGLSSSEGDWTWTDDEMRLLELVGTIFTNALQLKKTKLEASKIFDNTSDPFVIIDLDTDGLVKVNQAMSDVLGYTTEELYSRPHWEFVHPNDAERVRIAIESVASGGSPLHHLHFRLVKRDGTYFWADATLDYFPDEHVLFAAVRDITEQKRNEQELKKRLMNYSVDDGRVYLVQESEPVKSREAFEDILRIGYDGVVFSRVPHPVFKGSGYEHPRHRWLAESGEANAIAPDLEGLLEELGDLTSHSAILIERMDYLISLHGFDEVLIFVYRLKDFAYLNNSIVILSCDPGTLEGRMVRLLEKECDELEPIHKTLLSDELYSILKVVRSNSQRNVRVTYGVLLKELPVSKPTLRKRVNSLEYMGYLEEEAVGQKKTFVLTEKGRNLFAI